MLYYAVQYCSKELYYFFLFFHCLLISYFWFYFIYYLFGFIEYSLLYLIKLCSVFFILIYFRLSLFIYYSHHLFVIFIIYLLFYHIGLYVKKGILKEYKTDFGVVPNLVKLFQHLYGTISVRNLIIDIFFSNSFQNN